MLNWQIAVVFINLAVVLMALIAFRYGMSFVIGVHAKDELDKKDNFSFGVSVAGGTLAVMLIMSGAVAGVASELLYQEGLNVLMYAVSGVILLRLGFLIQDKLLLRGIELDKQVRDGNIAAGVVVAANLIAVGFIGKGSMGWIEDSGVYGLMPFIIVFLASQFVLGAATLLRLEVFSHRSKGGSWQDAITGGNIALSLRFAGQLIGTAIVITASSNLVNYIPTMLPRVGLMWLGISLCLMVLVWLLYKLITKIILSGVDIVQEVDVERNVGIASIEAAIFIGIASMITSFLS